MILGFYFTWTSASLGFSLTNLSRGPSSLVGMEPVLVCNFNLHNICKKCLTSKLCSDLKYLSRKCFKVPFSLSKWVKASWYRVTSTDSPMSSILANHSDEILWTNKTRRSLLQSRFKYTQIWMTKGLVKMKLMTFLFKYVQLDWTVSTLPRPDEADNEVGERRRRKVTGQASPGDWPRTGESWPPAQTFCTMLGLFRIF